jgi:glycosyltransferase involved in cell wall biosynthesis
MRIGVDGNLASDRRVGMGVMVFNVVLEAARAHPEHEFYLYVPKGPGYESAIVLAEAGAIVRALPAGGYPIWEQVSLPIAARRDRLDVFWAPYNTSSLVGSVPCVLTVHDLIYMDGSWTDQTTWYKRWGKLYRQVVVPRAVRRARSITTVSAYSGAEIADRFPGCAKKTSVVHLAPDVSEAPLTDDKWQAFRAANGIAGQYVLALSAGREKRKNVMRVLEAYSVFAEARDMAPQLVVFGHRGYESSDEWRWLQEHPHLRVTMLGYVSESEKASLYRHCQLLVFPSLAEGFGLPVLEAFESGVPVITSAGSALLEIAGDAAVTVDPLCVEEIANAMSLVVDNNHLASELVARGRERARHFSWQATSGAILSALTGAAP